MRESCVGSKVYIVRTLHSGAANKTCKLNEASGFSGQNHRPFPASQLKDVVSV
jgi:hypothetical protein